MSQQRRGLWASEEIQQERKPQDLSVEWELPALVA